MPSLLRHFFLGFVKIHILRRAAQEPVFGLALIRELARHGYELSPGTLYPVLHELERAGYVQREDRVVDRKVRKYYRATARGLQALDDARAKIRNSWSRCSTGRARYTCLRATPHKHKHVGVSSEGSALRGVSPRPVMQANLI